MKLSSYFLLNCKMCALQFIHHLPIMREPHDRFYHIHDIIEERAINIKGHKHAPFFFIR